MDLWAAAWAERPRLLAIARRRCRNRADAEEIVSEAILRVVVHPGTDPARLPAILRATTMRLCVDRLRERTVAERNAPRLFSRPADVTDELLDRMEAMWLAAEVARLADRERAALTARMLGLTVAETAEVLGVTYRAAEGLLGRARRKMRDVWARTLALLWPRRKGAWPFMALAVVGIVGAAVSAGRAGRSGERSAPVVERAQAVRTGGGWRPSAKNDPRPSPAQPGMPHGALSSSATPPLLTTPDLHAGPVHAHPSVITVDPSDPVGRIERCVANGVEVRVSEKEIGVVCREGSSG